MGKFKKFYHPYFVWGVLYLAFFVQLLVGGTTEEHRLTLKSYLPIFSLQVVAFIILAYVIVKFALPFIKRAVKEKKQSIEDYLQSLEHKILTNKEKLQQLQQQLNNIEQIIEERKKNREKEIQKIASAIEKEIEEVHQKMLDRLKLEEELETLKLKIFLRDFVRNKIYNYIKENLSSKQLQNVQKIYEKEFLDKFTVLTDDFNFVSRLKTL